MTPCPPRPRGKGGRLAGPALRSLEERNRLAAQWTGLCRWVAKRVVLRRLSVEEAEAAGMLGLLRAAETFEPGRGQFNTHAVYWIRREIWAEEGRARLIHVPEHTRRPGDAGRAMAVGSLPDDPRRMPVAQEKEPLYDEDDRAALAAALRHLDPRSREVLRLRYEEDLILEEAGARLGITRERARQIQARAEAKLRRLLVG